METFVLAVVLSLFFFFFFFPFLHISVIRTRVHNLQRPQLDSNCPEALKSLIQRGWSANPEERPSFNEIAAELTAIAQALRSDPTCANIPAVVEKEPPSEDSQD